MLRKKHITIQSKENTTPGNAKVTVQYIQPQLQPIMTKSPTTNASHHPTLDNSAGVELEVEYLEETANSDEFGEEQIGEALIKEEFEDTFYPNAILCLLDLYKVKYDTIITKTKCGQMTFRQQLWQNIAKEMHESYFEFEADQIRQKYAALRQQYFEIRSADDIENFEYFEKLHEIYTDPSKDAILNGGTFRKVDTQILYKDENLMEPVIYLQTLPEAGQCSDFKSEVIVHKEHEFAHMVKKGLQDIHKPAKSEEKPANVNTTPGESNLTLHQTPKTQKSLKRRFEVTASSPGEPFTQRSKPSECNEAAPPSPPTTEHTSEACYSELMTLKQYNVEQERRHREQMDFLDKQFRQHQKTLDQLNYQLQELIKRLPPAL